MINAAAQKKILDGKGSLKLSVRDIFKWLNPHGSIGNIPHATATYYNQADTRIVSFSFIYSFTKGVAEKGKRNVIGSGSEEGRVKNWRLQASVTLFVVVVENSIFNST